MSYIKTGWALFTQYPFGFLAILMINITSQVLLGYIPVVGDILGFIISCPLLAGFYVGGLKLLQHQPVTFKDLFGGFNFFGQLVLANFLIAVFVVIGLVLLIAPGVYLMVAYFFVIPLIVDRRMNFWSAMETSRHTIGHIWFKMFGLFLLLLLLTLAGLLCFVVGILISTCVAFLAIVAAYADIMGIEGKYSSGA
jgi:uncharacterized membrane protein